MGLDLRVRRDWNSNNKDVVFLSKEPPEASVIASHIKVPHVQALQTENKPQSLYSFVCTGNISEPPIEVSMHDATS